MNSKAQQSSSYFNRILDRYVQRFIINKDYKSLIRGHGIGNLPEGSISLSRV